MEQTSFHPLDYMTVVHRRKWWFIVPLALCIALGGAALSVWPKKFLSRATIGVNAPTLSPELMRGVSSMDPAERQRAISQLLLSPTVLDRVIKDEKINPSRPPGDVAIWLRDNLARNLEVPPPVGLNGRPDPTRGIDLFYLGYTDKDPGRAQRIANRVAAVFVEENSKVQTVRAENTADMLEQQLKESETRLSDLENKLRAKKQNYVGRLPEQIGSNVQMVNGARQTFDSLSLQIRSEQEHLGMVESRIESMRHGSGGEVMTSSAMAAAQTAQKHLDDLQGQLAAGRAKGWTDRHPEIQRLEREIKDARADVQAAKTEQPANREELLKTDPLYHAAVQERDMAKLHLKELQAAADNARNQISAYQSRVESAPVVEQDLQSVQREFDMERDRYKDLNSRVQAARSAEDVARRQGGERFSVLFPATYPTDPIEPQPLKVWAIAIVAGFVLGAGAALGREFLDRSVHDSRALQNEFEVPVLGEIPRITAA